MNESQVPVATWQAAIDHNFSVIFDLAMGGGFPNGVCGCATPTSSTTSGASDTVAYVAAYRKTASSAPSPLSQPEPVPEQYVARLGGREPRARRPPATAKSFCRLLQL